MEIIDINQEQQRTQHRTLGDTMTNLQIEECKFEKCLHFTISKTQIKTNMYKIEDH